MTPQQEIARKRQQSNSRCRDPGAATNTQRASEGAATLGNHRDNTNEEILYITAEGNFLCLLFKISLVFEDTLYFIYAQSINLSYEYQE